MVTCYSEACVQKSATSKMSAYRKRMRAAGLRPLQIWVPDTRSAKFAEEARKQSLRAKRSKAEREALDFIDAAADFETDT